MNNSQSLVLDAAFQACLPKGMWINRRKYTAARGYSQDCNDEQQTLAILALWKLLLRI